MLESLLADMERCFGHSCTRRESCKRFLTLPLDDAYDAKHGARFRSYNTNLCNIDEDSYLEDVKC
jgi:hypothetical protein